MSTKTLALAAALFATSSLATAANAGGLRVGLTMGGPLGNFTAHEYQSDTGRSYAKPNCHKPQAVARSTPRNYDNDPPVRRAKKPAPKVEVAEAPVRKVTRAPKVEVAEAPAPRPRKIKVYKPVEQAPVEVKTAKLEDKAVVNDAAPSIYVPETPPVAQSDVKGTQSTPAAQSDVKGTQSAPAAQSDVKGTQSAPAVRTAAITVEPDPKAAAASTPATEPAPIEPAKAETVKVEKLEKAEAPVETKAEPAPKKAELPSKVQRLCRRFSAAIAGLIDVPCE